MRVVRCPRCGHENRAAISVSICDRCAADISTAPDLNARGDERDLRINPAEVVVEEIPTALVEEATRPEPTASPPAGAPLGPRLLALLGRLLLAAAAVGIGIAGGLSFRLGTALEADQQLAGSIAILAAASGISGLVLLLVGGSPDRSQGVTWGLRTVGFLLAVLGVWAVTVIAHVAIQGREPPDGVPQGRPETMVPGPIAGPGMAMEPGAGGAPMPEPMGAPGAMPEMMGGEAPPWHGEGSGPPSGGGPPERPPTKG
ncbi:MAG: hypothetical protein FJX74_07050 [Armatimonadetes bacterium]|nr:hypothetical protein [Armatimonadota bacterium]